MGDKKTPVASNRIELDEDGVCETVEVEEDRTMGDRNSSHSSGNSNRNHLDESNPRRRRNTNKDEVVDDESETLELERDRISDLPDSLLLQILSLLPLPQVIRTGTLAKRWQELWTLIPNLVFTPRTDFPPFSRTLLTRVINRTLMQSCASKIDKFSVHISCIGTVDLDIDLWIRIATRKNVEDLSLDFSNRKASYRYRLPQHLFTYPSESFETEQGCSCTQWLNYLEFPQELIHQ